MKNCVLLTADSEHLYDDNLYSFADASKIVADLEARAQEAESCLKAYRTRRQKRIEERILMNIQESDLQLRQYLNSVERCPIAAEWVEVPVIKQLNIT